MKASKQVNVLIKIKRYLDVKAALNSQNITLQSLKVIWSYIVID